MTHSLRRGLAVFLVVLACGLAAAEDPATGKTTEVIAKDQKAFAVDGYDVAVDGDTVTIKKGCQSVYVGGLDLESITVKTGSCTAKSIAHIVEGQRRGHDVLVSTVTETTPAPGGSAPTSVKTGTLGEHRLELAEDILTVSKGGKQLYRGPIDAAAIEAAGLPADEAKKIAACAGLMAASGDPAALEAQAKAACGEGAVVTTSTTARPKVSFNQASCSAPLLVTATAPDGTVLYHGPYDRARLLAAGMKEAELDVIEQQLKSLPKPETKCKTSSSHNGGGAGKSHRSGGCGGPKVRRSGGCGR